MPEAGTDAAELLLRSPEEAARRLALIYLEEAAAALPRLAAGDDDEALHDVRVALRRLRSCLRSYAPQLGDSVPPKLARRLERLARSTGPGRDVEVQIEWLRQAGRDLSRHHRIGLAWLLAQLEKRHKDAYRGLRAHLEERFPPFATKLRADLSVYRAEVRLDGDPPSFGAAAAAILRQHAADLARRLARIEGPGDVRPAHRARISAKRLRYLAEPLADVAQASPLVQRLKSMQDVLGELHDAHVMADQLAAALGEAAAERARRLLDATLTEDGVPDERRLRGERRRPLESGLLALARLNRARRDRLFAQFTGRFGLQGDAPLAAAVEQLAQALIQRGHAGATAPGEEAGAPTAAPGQPVRPQPDQ